MAGGATGRRANAKTLVERSVSATHAPLRIRSVRRYRCGGAIPPFVLAGRRDGRGAYGSREAHPAPQPGGPHMILAPVRRVGNPFETSPLTPHDERNG